MLKALHRLGLICSVQGIKYPNQCAAEHANKKKCCGEAVLWWNRALHITNLAAELWKAADSVKNENK